MKRLLLIALLLTLSQNTLAQNLSFYMIHPNGEGDTQAARPYLESFFDYLKEQTDISLNGLYLNDPDEAVEALEDKKINIAIVSPEFFDQYQKKFNFEKILKTIPAYSNGPFEKFYIMTQKDTDILKLTKQNISVNLFSSQTVSEDFLNKQVFVGNDEIKKVPWKLRQTDDILAAIKKIAAGEPNTFVLLSGYEFSVIKKLNKTNTDFNNLKLIYTSPELASSSLVAIGKTDAATLDKIKNALLTMPTSLKGNLILNKLRLKGFAGL